MWFISGYEWQYALIFLSLITLIIGFVISRNMPLKKKKFYNQRFACAAGIPLVLIFVFDNPKVSFISKTEFLFQEQKAENLTSFDEIIKHEKDQAKNIFLLKEEIEKLRKELDEVNDYYGNLTRVISIAVTIYLFLTVFKKEDLEENQSNNSLN